MALHVTNVTKEIVLIENGRVADNSWTRLKGLIGVRDLAHGDGLLIKPCKGVHCMFMSIPIDVLHVDRHDRVIAMRENMPPWRIGGIRHNSSYVIELPAGTLARTSCSVGDQLAVTIR